VQITVAGNLNATTVENDITTYLQSKGYKNSTVAIQSEKNTTKISLKTSVDKDEQVNILSKDIE